jgi:hypothetical protein
MLPSLFFTLLLHIYALLFCYEVALAEVDIAAGGDLTSFITVSAIDASHPFFREFWSNAA